MATKETGNSRAGTAGKTNVTEKIRQTGSSAGSTRPPLGVKEVSTTKTKRSAAPTYEQISERAKAIWQQRGCRPGEDERNWLEAERQLLEQEEATVS